MALKIKVCGMCQPFNIGELVKLNPGYVGFIFYPKSKRYIGMNNPDEIRSLIPPSIKKTGVFVDEPLDSLLENFENWKLNIVQLHGAELPEYCERLKKLNIPVIKAFSISQNFDFETIKSYSQVCDYYLFDTAGELPGGTGLKFNWAKLKEYQGNKPFFLSGGIQPGDAEKIKSISHNKLYAVDVNSGFEVEPGLKDILKLKLFIEQIRGKEAFRLLG